MKSFALPVLILPFNALVDYSGTMAAVACTCNFPPPPKISLKQADVVFSGRVENIKLQNLDLYVVQIEVDRVWKGTNQSTVIVTTASAEACGFSFQKGMSYLIYAYRTRGKDLLSTNHCTRTALLSHAQEDLKALGNGRKVRMSHSGSSHS